MSPARTNLRVLTRIRSLSRMCSLTWVCSHTIYIYIYIYIHIYIYIYIYVWQGHLSKGHTSRSWQGDTNVDNKSNSLTARKRHLMWERKSVSATVLHGHSPVKFGLKKSVVLLKLFISFFVLWGWEDRICWPLPGQGQSREDSDCCSFFKRGSFWKRWLSAKTMCPFVWERRFLPLCYNCTETLRIE